MTNTTILDTNWIGQPHAIAAALLESDGHCAIVDPGPESTLATLREGLRAHGLGVGDLDSILLTHIHLDHAGATGSLVRENPRLAVYVHVNGAPHMVDPSKLLASAARLWPDNLTQLFGDTLPVPQENLRVLEGGETVALGGRKLSVTYTPGHASHHVTYFDESSGVAFVGDTAGVRIENGPYILAATPPPDVDLAAWDASFAAIRQLHPARLFLTHFGYSDNPAAHIADYRERLHRWVGEAEEILRSTSDEAAAMAEFISRYQADAEASVGKVTAEQLIAVASLHLSFLGIVRYLRKRAKAAV